METKQVVLHPSDSRGRADFGWLKSRHSFSFGQYYEPSRMNFGALRVLNDDIVAPGKGFGMHRHDNMEIVSIPLKGDLEHKDSMGNVAVIREGDIQVMSAGTGIFHSEFNKNADRSVEFLQIWIIPDQQNVAPRYDQKELPVIQNTIQQILSPEKADEGLWIHQQAWFHLGRLNKGFSNSHNLKNPGVNGIYAFVIEGRVIVEDQNLQKRDGIGLWEIDKIEINANDDSVILLMEVPMI